ncbi:MAG: hypothetical protein ACI861_001163 [Paracoccaceae bacterium]|jgi:hypothetical protein
MPNEIRQIVRFCGYPVSKQTRRVAHRCHIFSRSKLRVPICGNFKANYARKSVQVRIESNFEDEDKDAADDTRANGSGRCLVCSAFRKRNALRSGNHGARKNSQGLISFDTGLHGNKAVGAVLGGWIGGLIQRTMHRYKPFRTLRSGGFIVLIQGYNPSRRHELDHAGGSQPV